MTPQMMEILHRISLLYAPEPETVFQKVAEAAAEVYPQAMVMINLVEGDCMRYRTAVNLHPAMAKRSHMKMKFTLCQFAIASNSPLLIQNAAEDSRYCRHAIVAMRLRRYLGVPICDTEGNSYGTLCFLDDRTDQILESQDIQFLSLLAMRVSAELERERILAARQAEQEIQEQERRRHQADTAEALRERNVALNRLAQQRAELNAQLQAQACEKRHFVNMVIHDLRHPLTTMRTTLHLLRIDPDPHYRLEHLAALENRTRALSSLLDELILYDQIEAGKPHLHIEEREPGEIITSCIAEVAGMPGAETVPIRRQIAPDLGPVSLDAGKLRHILLNLLANALKFTPEGEVTVRAGAVDRERWKLEVEDTGIGMDSLERQHAFEEYFSGRKETEGGMGLGLAITRRLCTALNAEVTVNSVPGQGTHFSIVFPRSLTLDVTREVMPKRRPGRKETRK